MNFKDLNTINKRRGMAILIALTVCTFLLIFTTTLFQQNKNVMTVEFRVKESLRAQYLAKGAHQMALLKIRELPTELYDAVRWHKGWINEAQSTGDIRMYIPNISAPVGLKSDSFLNYYTRFAVTNANPVGNTQLIGNRVTAVLGVDKEQLYYAADVANDGFVGDCLVKQILLVSQYNNNRIDGIEIVAEGSEDPGNQYSAMMNGVNAVTAQYNSVHRKVYDIGYLVVR